MSRLLVLRPEQLEHQSGDRPRPVLLWRLAEPAWAISSAVVGGGIGRRSWVLNAEVPSAYDRTDVTAHVADIAAGIGCEGLGVGMLTAAAVGEWTSGQSRGVEAAATVGLSAPTWAAAPDPVAPDEDTVRAAGTINVVAWVPVRLSPGALVNAVATATEAKTQALVEVGVPGTGTASDALCVLCPDEPGDGEPFGGPRSSWGAPLARAVHAAVLAGCRRAWSP
jgi:adenosylcobinamide amidohydrolase